MNEAGRERMDMVEGRSRSRSRSLEVIVNVVVVVNENYSIRKERLSRCH